MDRRDRREKAAETKPPGDRRGTNPNSLANLDPVKPGDPPRNRIGVNGQRPYSAAIRAMADQPVPEVLREMLNKQMLLLVRKWVGQRTEIPEMFEEGISWCRANALRLHLKAVLGGDIQAAIEVREAVEGCATQRLELAGRNDRLAALIDALNNAREHEPEDSVN